MPVDCWALLPRITAPTLVVRGEHSTILDRDVAERMVKTLPSAGLADDPRALADTIGTWAR
jgi:pimeloyl-ACP methyl ester carboxylesterase